MSESWLFVTEHFILRLWLIFLEFLKVENSINT